MKKNFLVFTVLIISFLFGSVKLFAQDIPGGSADGVLTDETPVVSSSPIVVSSSTSSSSFITAFAAFFKSCPTTKTCNRLTPCVHASCYRSNIVSMFTKGYINFLGMLQLYNHVPKECNK